MLGVGAALAMLAACHEAGDDRPPATATAAPAPGCGESGFLAATLYGAIATTLDWSAADLACEGMPRPNDEGARLRFAGRDGDRQLAIIIAVPALTRGATGAELPSNVTLIEEGNGRFFSTPDLNSCWTDVTVATPVPRSASEFVVGGTLYCVQPIVEVNGTASVTLSELRFEGLVDWGTG